MRIGLWNPAFLGDAVLTLPLAQSLRLSRPEARIDFYVRKGLESLFLAHPDIDGLFPVDKKGGVEALFRMKKEIASRKYDLWISAHTSFRSGLAARFSGAAVRIGYQSPLVNRFFYTGVVDRRFNELDEVERLLELLNPLEGTLVSPWPRLRLCDEDEREAQAFFSLLQGPALGLHPGSVWPTKRWPAAYFAEIGRRAAEEGADVLLFAGPGEEGIAAEVHAELAKSLRADKRRRLHDLSGQLSLPLLAAYLKRLSVYLTNDSGPMHLAWAQGVPVTALFGPTVKRLGFFPRGASSTVMETELDCRPCGLHGPKECPKGHHHCMTRLLPETVWSDVRQKLFGPNSRPAGFDGEKAAPAL